MQKHKKKEILFKERERQKAEEDSSYKKKLFRDVLPQSNINYKKSDTAFMANTMHCTDAAFLSKIVLESEKRGLQIHTVHDEFIVPVNRFFEVLEITNKAYSDLYYEINNQNTDLKSFFILL